MGGLRRAPLATGGARRCWVLVASGGADGSRAWVFVRLLGSLVHVLLSLVNGFAKGFTRLMRFVSAEDLFRCRELAA